MKKLGKQELLKKRRALREGMLSKKERVSDAELVSSWNRYFHIHSKQIKKRSYVNKVRMIINIPENPEGDSASWEGV